MSAHYYRSLLVQRPRMEAFDAAIRARVRPGARVLEVGAGVGTYAMFAARAGADRVWAVEGGSIAPVTRQILRDNGLDGRVRLLEGWYPEVQPPERVDLVIYEDYGPRLLDRWSWSVLQHVSQAALADGGTVLPGRARVWIAPVCSPEKMAAVARFGPDGDRLYGLDWEATRESAANAPLAAPIRAEELVAAPWLVDEFALLPPPDASLLGRGRAATWEIARPVEVHGLAFWFDLEVGDGVWLSNAPGGSPGSWGHLFLPAPGGMALAAGDTLSATVGFERGPGGEPGWMRWGLAGPREAWSAHEFRSSLATGQALERQGADWRPRLNAPGRVAARVLQMADGTRSVEDLAITLLDEGLAETRVQAEQFVSRTLAGHVG